MEPLNHKHCYGTMFPDALHFRSNVPNVGKVFSFELDSTVGMGAVRMRSHRQLRLCLSPSKPTFALNSRDGCTLNRCGIDK